MDGQVAGDIEGIGTPPSHFVSFVFLARQKEAVPEVFGQMGWRQSADQE